MTKKTTMIIYETDPKGRLKKFELYQTEFKSIKEVIDALSFVMADLKERERQGND